MAKLDTLATREEVAASALATKSDMAATRANVWAAMGVALGIMLAILAFAGDRFDAGFSQADQRQAQLDRDAKQDGATREALSKLDTLIARTAPAKP